MMMCGYGLQEEGVKFLGVLIDENLDWKLQCKSIKKKISKGNYLLWRYKNKLTIPMKKTFMKALSELISPTVYQYGEQEKQMTSQS